MHDKDLLVEEDWKVIESLLPEGWEEKAKELKAYQRIRSFEGPGPLLRTLLIHVADGCSYRQTSSLSLDYPAPCRAMKSHLRSDFLP